MPVVELPDGREVEFPEGVSPEDMTSALRRDFSDFFPAEPERRLLDDEETWRRKFAQEELTRQAIASGYNQPGTELTTALGGGASRALEYTGNVARAIPADIAAGLSLLKRPEGEAPMTPSLPAISENLPAAANASGNIPAALRGETTLPVDV